MKKVQNDEKNEQCTEQHARAAGELCRLGVDAGIAWWAVRQAEQRQRRERDAMGTREAEQHGGME